MSEFQAKIGEATPDCPTSLLDFDYENPRLTTGDNLSTHDEKNMICSLRDIAALDELIQSICNNGYFNLEPLIVLAKTDGRFTVLEGNRRLAAIKLIKDRELARDCKVSLPATISQKVLDSIMHVSVWRVQEKVDAQAFIGFKHIVGPYRWDAYAKARFVADWYKKDKSNGLTIESITRQLGDDNDTIRAYIGAVLVLEQAENERLFEIKDRYNRGRFAFSHLYTALGRKEYQEFLGLAKGWNQAPDEQPVNQKKISQLKEVLTYLYGSKKDDEPSLIKSQNPDLKNLGEILVHPVALEKIRGGADLKTAHNEVRDGGAVFSEALVQASLKIDASIALLAKYDGSSSLLSVATELVEKSETLLMTMLRKHGKSENK
ncbi:ParB/Srx family N-terminal domain-containing protein [Methylomonas fluvii]|uniref:ParB N-terminal domain-containing protein n=1 Tax=Methylomonas fluvii TaxID=1854564 RepID=A0ABR9D8L9_9GAMM|nr:ParB/Srx family N-terminal domain-containing protein [Methylomonas fluvii]MBD9359443.1 ParB N-terminal domain-containing protein [Methylomonas fluvii]